MTELEMYTKEVQVMEQYIEIWGDLMKPYLKNNVDLKLYVERLVDASVAKQKALDRISFYSKGAEQHDA